MKFLKFEKLFKERIFRINKQINKWNNSNNENNNCENWKVNLEIGKLKNYLEVECQKIKFRKLETRKIILRLECRKIKF